MPISVADWRDIPVFVPAVHKSELRQQAYLINPALNILQCIEIDMSPAAAVLAQKCMELQKDTGLQDDLFPYGCTEKNWPAYCLAPHSYRSIGEQKVQVGLNIAGQFLHVDFHAGTAELVDPEIGDQFVSTTNWVDPQTQELWFGSWAMEDTFRRAAEPDKPVQGSLWKYDFNTDSLAQIWEGETGDSLHQVSISPDRRYAVICEMGLHAKDAQPAKRLYASKYMIVDMANGQDWNISVPTAAHVEFDPMEPSRCYVSSHNIGLINGKVGIFGPGIMRAYTLTPDGPIFDGEFSKKDFFRITTHVPFVHRGKTMLAVTGYPGSIFLIDSKTMTLVKTIDLGVTEEVKLTHPPHICAKDSYGIIPSSDGEHVLVAQSGKMSVATIHDGRLEPWWNTNAPDADHWCFTGHVGCLSAK
jgi:hypothetical protein